MSDEPINFMTKDDHKLFCAINERKTNERFSLMLDRFVDGTERMNRIEDSLNEIKASLQLSVSVADDRMDRLDAGLQQNTAVTQEVKDILDTAKGAFKFFSGVGSVLKWVLGLGASGLAFWVALKDFRSH